MRERRRVARILLLLAVLFAFCWLPYNVMALLFDMGVRRDMQLLSFSLLLGHANSAINPVLYCFMTRNFRRAVRELVFRSKVSLATRQHQRCNVSPLRVSTLFLSRPKCWYSTGCFKIISATYSNNSDGQRRHAGGKMGLTI